ncbi:MAG: hypothetical protein D4R92_02490 [Actinobacteria bacterium]|nr:MAG: hypothetical protein D4R92_02490 [Actinomycetota bacterium]
MKTRYFYLVCLTLLASSCATTINQSAVTTVASSSEPITQVTINSQLTTDELLSELFLAVEDLSKSMQKTERSQVSQQLAQVISLSDAIRPKILATSDQLASDFDRVINLSKSAVERNRPADADKSLRFLLLIIDSLKNF